MTITNQEDIEILIYAMSRYVDDIRNDLEAGFIPISKNILKDNLKVSEQLLKKLRKEIQSRAS